MKKFILVIGMASLLMLFSSCKKGENDPFLTLKSRKSRISGNYEYDSYEKLSTTKCSSTSTSECTTATVLSNGVLTKTITCTNEDCVGSNPEITNVLKLNKGEWIFEKDGVFTHTWNTIETELTENEDTGVISDFIGLTEMEETGTWNFLGRVDEFKNKERLVLNTLKKNYVYNGKTTYSNGDEPFERYIAQKNTFSDGFISDVYEIDMLRNKEMTFIKRLEKKSSSEQSLSDKTSSISFTLIQK